MISFACVSVSSFTPQARDKYKQWEISKEKTFVVVVFQTPNAGLQRWGTFEIDMNCTLHIAREFLRRSFWRELNDVVGAAFDFLRQGTAVLEHEEAVTKIHDVAPRRLNSATREVENSLTLCASTSREAVLLEPCFPVPWF